jgi:uncharacterized protein (TIGR02594 family)
MSQPKEARTGPPKPSAPAYYKSDSITLDTSRAPWMKFAREQKDKDIRENPDYDSFEKLWYNAIAINDSERSLAKSLGVEDTRPEQPGSPFDQTKPTLGFSPDYKGKNYLLKPLIEQRLGKPLQDRNPEINKYFEGLKTDPDYDKKARSWDVSPVSHSKGGWEVTSWCAAFVNWCLKQAGEPHLGLATAASWLKFGTPLATPAYGCVTIVPPSRSTRSSTGHVTFYVETKGKNVVLLGGNQSHRVKMSEFSHVLGYRWPTKFNYYLLDQGSRSALV